MQCKNRRTRGERCTGRYTKLIIEHGFICWYCRAGPDRDAPFYVVLNNTSTATTWHFLFVVGYWMKSTNRNQTLVSIVIHQPPLSFVYFVFSPIQQRRYTYARNCTDKQKWKGGHHGVGPAAYIQQIFNDLQR
ncbi:hypothetical protein OUZ56_001187 [Daphnia magna]|uniref:Uncharacterized protein n=1 Tax=Daphnia magna TaxID=35525 RepID=A0ABR0A1W8_9CRUS|nr:hypothetical protein OUZ56_001187 [Daphnia magna]